MLVDPCKTYRVTAIFGANLLRTLEASEEFVQPLRLLLKVGSLQLVYVVGYQWMSLWVSFLSETFEAVKIIRRT